MGLRLSEQCGGMMRADEINGVVENGGTAQSAQSYAMIGILYILIWGWRDLNNNGLTLRQHTHNYIQNCFQ